MCAVYHQPLFSQSNLRVAFYVPPNPAIDPTKHLVDHVHLNKEGYDLYGDALCRGLQEAGIEI